MLHAQLIGYGWAFSAAIGNGIQDNLRKYATKSIKNPLHVVAMMEMLNCVTLFLFVFCTGQGELIFGKRKPLFNRQKHESSRSYNYGDDDDQIARTHLIVLASISALIKCVGSVAFQRALQLTPISLCAPYMAFTPLWLLGLSFFIVHEIPSARGVFGVVVMTGGAYGLNSAAAGSGGGAAAGATTMASGASTLAELEVGIDERKYHREGGAKSRSSGFSGNRSGSDGSMLMVENSTNSGAGNDAGNIVKKDGVVRTIRRAVRESLGKQASALRKQPGSLIAFGVAGLWGLTSDIDKLGKNASAHAGGFIVYVTLQRIFMAAPLGMITAALNPEAFGYLKNPKTLSIIFGMGLCELYTVVAYLHSLEHLFTSYAVAAKRSGILLSVLGGAIMFKEPIGDRLPYVFVIIIGMMCIILADEY